MLSNEKRGSSSPVVLSIACLLVLAHLLTASRYGIFRDELYYIDCSRHLGAGYVDHPPLIAWITWIVLHTIGSSLIALRLLPALASGLLVWMTARIAQEWGGGRYAQFLAALSIASVPIYLILQHWLTMNAFEPLCWAGIFWAASRLLLRQDPRYLVSIGVLAGIGLENKYSIVFPFSGPARWNLAHAGTEVASIAISCNCRWSRCTDVSPEPALARSSRFSVP